MQITLHMKKYILAAACMVFSIVMPTDAIYSQVNTPDIKAELPLITDTLTVAEPKEEKKLTEREQRKLERKARREREGGNEGIFIGAAAGILVLVLLFVLM